MKLLRYELKKIFHIKIIIALILFTILFYDLFMNSKYFATNDFGAEPRLCTMLMERYGTTLPVKEIGVLGDIKSEYTEKLDKAIAGNEVFQKAGIHDFAQMKAAEYNDDKKMPEELEDELTKIQFEEPYGKDNFLIQEIEYIQEHFNGAESNGRQYAGLEKQQAKIYARENARYEVGEENADKISEAYYLRKEKLYTSDSISLLPCDALDCAIDDLPYVGLLMLISCIILIIPYQIREKIKGVNSLFLTTKTGRRLWSIRFISALITSVIVSMTQFGVFLLYLRHYGILKYIKCPVYNLLVRDSWLDINFGTWLLLNGLALVLFVTGVVIIFFLISRISSNYVVGFAATIPLIVLFGFVFTSVFTAFLIMYYSLTEVFVPIGIILVAIMMTIIIGLFMSKLDQRKDVVT